MATESTTQQKITEAAIELFSQQGYYATSLRQVADRVGIQVGSLYNHIRSKEELLFSIMRQVMMELIDYTRSCLAEVNGDALERLTTILRASIRFHATRPRETFIGNSELRGLTAERRAEIVKLRDEYEAIVRDAIDAGARAGAYEVEDVQLSTYAALAMCTSVATWYRADGRLSLEELDSTLPLMFGPIASARARADRPG